MINTFIEQKRFWFFKNVAFETHSLQWDAISIQFPFPEQWKLVLQKTSLYGFIPSWLLPDWKVTDAEDSPILINSRCIKTVRIRSYTGPYFPTFRLHTERYSVSVRIYTVSHRIQFECWKIHTRITPNTVTFNAVSKFEILLYVLHKSIKILTKKEIQSTFANG